MKRALQHNLGMTVGLISGAMLFTTLFMGYAIYRLNAVAWPPMGVGEVSLALPALSTLMILISSWFCRQSQVAVLEKDFSRASNQLNLTLLCGFSFMLVQSLFWYQLKSRGVFVESGIFASILYGFTWIHAAHVLGGLGALIYLKLVLKPTTTNIWQKSVNVEKFWHFLGIIWVLMFVFLFVV